MPDLSQYAALGWGTAAAVLAILLAVAAFRSWARRDGLCKEIADAEQDYRKAVASRDPDRVRIAAARLQKLRGKAGET